MFTYPIYNHNWRNIITIYIYKTRLASNEILPPSNKIHRKIGRAKDLSAPRHKLTFALQLSGQKRHIMPKFRHRTKLWFKCSISQLSSLNLDPVMSNFLVKKIFRMLNVAFLWQ